MGASNIQLGALSLSLSVSATGDPESCLGTRPLDQVRSGSRIRIEKKYNREGETFLSHNSLRSLTGRRRPVAAPAPALDPACLPRWSTRALRPANPPASARLQPQKTMSGP